MAFLPKIRPRRPEISFHIIRLVTIGLVLAQLYYVGKQIFDRSRSGDTINVTTIVLWTARLLTLVALVPTLLACYLRPATLRSWSLAIVLLCAFDIGLAVSIQPRTMIKPSGYDVVLACVMTVIQIINLGIRWCSYGPAHYDEPVLRPEILNAESDSERAPHSRDAPESMIPETGPEAATVTEQYSGDPKFNPCVRYWAKYYQFSPLKSKVMVMDWGLLTVQSLAASALGIQTLSQHDHSIFPRWMSILAIIAPIPTILLGTVVSLMILAAVPLDHKVGKIARVDGIAAAAFLSTIIIYQVVGFSCCGCHFPRASAGQLAAAILLICATAGIFGPLLALFAFLASSAASMERILRDMFLLEPENVVQVDESDW